MLWPAKGTYEVDGCCALDLALYPNFPMFTLYLPPALCMI